MKEKRDWIAEDGLVGTRVLTYTEDHRYATERKMLQGQGLILARVEPRVYLVQWFSWIAGDALFCSLVDVEDMLDWTLYTSLENLEYDLKHGNASSCTGLAFEKHYGLKEIED